MRCIQHFFWTSSYIHAISGFLPNHVAFFSTTLFAQSSNVGALYFLVTSPSCL